MIVQQLRVAVAGLAVGLLAATPAPAPAADTIQLGAILPLTGPGGVIGVQEQRGIEFAVTRANAAGGVGGRQVALLIEDNQAKPDQSVLSFNKLVDLNHVPVVFTGYSGPTLAMAPLATRDKTLLVNAGAQADKLATASPYLINTLPGLKTEVGALSKYLVTQGKKSAAVLYENDAAGIAGRDDFRDTYTAAGGKLVGQEPVPFGETNFRPALLKLAAAQPDVLFIVLTGNNAQVADQAKQLAWKGEVAGTTFFADPSTMNNPAANGWIHTQLQIDAPPDLQSAFKQAYDADMEFFANQYYNAAAIVLKCLDKVVAENKPLTGENIRQALFDIRRFQGLIPLEFTSNTATMEIDIDRIQDGKNVQVAKAVAE